MIGRDAALSTDAQFIPLLDRELKKACLFYEAQEKELLDDVTELQQLVQKQEESGSDGEHHFMVDDDDDDEDDEEDEFNPLSPSLSAQGTTRSFPPSNHRRRRSRSESGFSGDFYQA